MLFDFGAWAVNFGPGPASIFFQDSTRKIGMNESERIRLVQEANTKYISRNKCVDSSLLTMVRQAQASKAVQPTRVAAKVCEAECGSNATIQGKGTNMEYLNILQSEQACAVCPTNPPSDTGVIQHVVLPTVCVNNLAVPFTQQNLSTMYVAPCAVPGFNKYFPTPLTDGSNCSINRIFTPSG
jgi:hypothetical protein